MDPNEEIVISGISGRFPECNNVEEFMEALLNGVDLITDDERRSPRGVLGIPARSGKIPHVDKFDATFFGVHAKQAEIMDPRHRILCETAYETIIDAGYNPQELRGSNTGVYVGLSPMSNLEDLRELETDGYLNIGLNMGLAANRISYCLDLKGKSYCLETACSSTFYGLVNAVDDIKCGNIDAAIISGALIMFHPHETAEFNKLNMLAADGKCKVFNTVRDGYARAEAAISIFLQKKSVSRRVYATVLGARSNADGYKMEGITYPSSVMQLALMKTLYQNIDVNIDEVNYVEAHGTGTPAGDYEELKAITAMFCKNRQTPLPVGAVKSNMGHAETASGLCSIAKVLIAMESGVIPANLHLECLDTSLPGVKEDTIKIVTKNLPWTGGVTAVNCFGFGGTNSHIVLKSNPKEKSKTYKRPKYRLVQVSGRTEEAVNYFLDEIEKHQDDEEFLALVDEIHKLNCESHNFRGYVILGEKPKREVSRYTKGRPVWLIYAGMGSQWLGMGRDLMRNEVFKNAIKRCHDALKPYDVNLEEIVTNPPPNVFDNSVNSFPAITAVEIALTDLLYSLDIKPDGFAGHSLGEIGCSYADGNLSPEDTVLSAYARGYSTTCDKMPAGLMAAVGLSKEDCQKLLPDDIFIACQNGKHNVTISGPEQSTLDFIQTLTSRGIFAKKVDSGGLAYHSKYIKNAVPHLYDFVKNVLKNPVPRSSKWLSTSVAEHQRNEDWAQYNSVEYHLNNFGNTVLFDEIYKHIPKNAIVVEVAPHGLMQAILKRELDPNNTILSLANRNSPDNEEWFLTNIGKLYLAGAQPNLRNLYKGVTFPVGRGTKMLAPLVKWDHGIRWMAPLFKHKDYFGNIIRVNISNEQHSYLSGHNIDGRVLMPATGYMELAWRTLALLHLKDMEQLPVVIKNIKFKRATVLQANTEVKFLVNIMKLSGDFEIFEGGSVICTGTICTMKDVAAVYYNASCPKIQNKNCLMLNSNDVYQECRIRRYFYEGYFQGIKECDVNGLRGRIKWQGNFCSFLDTMLHLTVISETKRDLLVPSSIKQVVIDPWKLLNLVAEHEDLPIFFNPNVNVIRCGPVEIRGVESSKIPRRKQMEEDLLLETYQFLPYENTKKDNVDVSVWLAATIQIIVQNCDGFTKILRICEFPATHSSDLIMEIKKNLEVQPMVEAQYIQFSNNQQNFFDVVVLTEDLLKEIDVNSVIEHLSEQGMVLYKGDIKNLNAKTNNNLNVVFQAMLGNETIYLLRYNQRCNTYSVIHVNNSEFTWIEKLKNLVRSQTKGVIVLVSRDDYSGLMGLTKCLLTEPNNLALKCVLIQDTKAPTFSVENEFYKAQLNKNLTFNVLRNGEWGTYLHLPLNALKNKEVENVSVGISTVGDLSTLNWTEKSSYVQSDPETETVYVYYSSLNFKDVMVATGKLQLVQADEPTLPEINIGLEYAGTTSHGKRVMGMVGCEGLSLQVQSDPGFTWEVPEGWSLADAATVPSVYATCYYAMMIRGRIQPGESILVHAGTGGIGIAAISVALSIGCVVFTTVGSEEKREYLKQLYPQISDENIGHSRNTSFAKMVMENTNGQGVDLVLNSLSGELFHESLACIAPGGRFLEIGKVEFVNSTPIESKMFLKNCSLHGIFLDELFRHPSRIKEEIRNLLDQGIKNGVVKPLPKTIFNENEIEDAFRFLSSGKHKGKVVIELRKEDTTNNLMKRTISAVPKIFFDPKKTYIITGGLGGAGLEFADWLMRKGATKIILNSRRQVHTGYQSYCLRKWSKWNEITVQVNTDDTSTLEGARNLVSFANGFGPVGGVLNMAVDLKDGLIENQTPAMYEAVFKAKVVSGRNMDIVTRESCHELDHFIVFSSLACGRGNIGQSNYGMANSALEQLCEKRQSDNLPALAVQWGPIADVGLTTKNKLRDNVSEKVLPQSLSSCMDTLERFILQDSLIGSSVILPSKNVTKPKGVTKTPAEAVAHVLGFRDLELIDKSLTLAQLGLDSLMVVEIKQTLYRNYQIEMSTDELRDLTFMKLVDISTTSEDSNDKVHEAAAVTLPKELIITMKQAEDASKAVFLIHPIEGDLELLKGIASQLESVVYGIQCTKDADFESVEEYASYYVRKIKSKQANGPYILCGYSLGAVIALEMGFQLERRGESAQLISIDASPEYVRCNLKRHFEEHENSVDKSKTAILINFISHFIKVNHEKVVDQLTTKSEWKEQLRLVGELVSKETGLDAGEVSNSADRYYKRFLAGFTYNTSNIFTGKILLIRSDTNGVLASEDYGLQKFCTQPIEIMKLNGDHKSVVVGENARMISEKINTLL